MPSDVKAHYDPRIGDEDEEESAPSQARPTPHIQVPASPPEPGSSSTSASDEKLKHSATKEKARIRPKGEDAQWQKVACAVISKIPLVNNLGWVKANLVFSKLKPVIRSSVAAWVAVVLLVVNPVLRTMGQVRFFACNSTRATRLA